MASLKDQFQHFYAPDEDAVATALREGLVTPDTNVLLSLYRFQSRARDELFSALERIGDRLWIPYQVGLEFYRNRLAVISEQESYFGKTRSELDASVDDIGTKVRTFAARIALDKDHLREIEDSVGLLQRLLTDEVTKAENANEVHLDSRDSDEVLARLEALFDNRVGEPMEPGELETARKEARRRVEARVPPGYMDKAKPDPTGDYLVWKQPMQEAGKRKRSTVLITDDRKEDWYRREHGLTLGARYELREEMMSEAGVPFLIMTTETFLLHAREYLNVVVSPETVDQAKELPGLSHIRSVQASVPVEWLVQDASMTRQQLHDAVLDRELAARFGTLSHAQRTLAKSILALRRQRRERHDLCPLCGREHCSPRPGLGLRR
jgi:PIN like domain